MLISMVSIILALTIFVFWHSHMKAREIGISLAKKLCDEAGVQLLDESISLRRTRLGRQESGLLRFKREYQFEYSEDGQIRRRGRVILLGHKKLFARLDHVQNQSALTSIGDIPSAEIIKLDQFKKTKNISTKAPAKND
jgi:hypothetical protein